MTSVDAVTAISAILAEHDNWDFGAYGTSASCICGVKFYRHGDLPMFRDLFNAHVASALASHMAGAQAEAWADGLAVATGMARIYGHTDHWPDVEPANPFTADTGNTE